MKTAMTIEYDGSAYCGFQIQNGQNSVQAELEKALAVALRQKVRVHCAGRTDTGVNALGQVIHFAADYPQSLNELIYSVNSLIPKDIAVRHAERVGDDFHARFACRAREYVYIVQNSPYRPTPLGFKALWVRGPLNWTLVREALPSLVGEKDFAGFTRVAVVKKGEKTLRRIDGIDIVESSPYVFIYIRGSGFLHNMVRILVGTFLDVAKGKMHPDKIAAILAEGDRLAAGVTQKSDPLYFLKADYADYPHDDDSHWLRRFLIDSLHREKSELR